MTLSVQLIKNSDNLINLVTIGSVKDVIAGVIQPALRTHAFDASHYRFGFELASPHSVTSLGEAVLVKDYCYATSTDPEDHYQHVIYGKTFYTSGMLLVPLKTQANYLLHPSLDATGICYEAFCEAIHQKIQRPCLYVALLKFKQLTTTHIKKTPIYGEPIFTHQNDYYGGTEKIFEDCMGFVIGVFANFTTDPSAITQQLGDVLYHNPFDKQSLLQSHTHGLVLHHPLPHMTALEPTDVQQVVHVYNKNTVITEILWGEIFVINQVNAL